MENKKGANENTDDWPDINKMNMDQLKQEL